ncbi:hypothetical protein [Streptomyces sp. NPDC059631]|uniref:hypothetical protein n=1 Tax=unclassified Streptomyces TaxID=2593676 RepID=UPI003676D4F8
MGIGWENILGTSGSGLNDAYDRAVSAVTTRRRAADHYQSAKSTVILTACADLSAQTIAGSP